MEASIDDNLILLLVLPQAFGKMSRALVYFHALLWETSVELSPQAVEDGHSTIY